MGDRNVDRVLLAQPPLGLYMPAATLLVLILMARRAHDDTGRYWAGTAWLQVAAGYPAGPVGRRAVRRHMATLTDLGYLKRLPETVGQHAVYQLQLPGIPRGRKQV
jgi:hypothetical protein